MAHTDPRGCGNAWLQGRLVVLDGAKRDRCPYIGDLAVSARTELLRSGSGVSVRNVLVGLARLHRPDGYIAPSFIHVPLRLIDFPAWWAVVLHDYVLYTGDKKVAFQLWPVLMGAMDDWYPSLLAPSGLISNPGMRNDYAFVKRTGPVVTYYNALYALALGDSAELARWLGRDEDAQRWTARQRWIETRVNDLLWDPGAHAYVDALGSDDTHPLDGNALALVSGTTSRERAVDVIGFLDRKLARPWGTVMADSTALDSASRAPSFILPIVCFVLVFLGLRFLVPRRFRRLARLPGFVFAAAALLLGILTVVVALFAKSTDENAYSQRVYPFISYFEIEGRFGFGDSAEALDEIRTTWGAMLTAYGAPGTTWEWIGKKADLRSMPASTSLAHGWSTGALPLLTEHVLGVRPLAPGYSHFAVAPTIGALKWAHGRIPTPNGPIEISVKQAHGTLSITIRSPPQDHADVRLGHAGRGAHVTLNGTSCEGSTKCSITAAA